MPAHRVRPKRARSEARLWHAQFPEQQTETFLARSVRGLEWLAAAEIEVDLNASVLKSGHREVVFRARVGPALFELGSEIVKALALGAQAVCIGRPYLWGLGAFGQAGVERVLDILRAETRLAMQQIGAPSLKELTRAMVRRA